MNERPADKLVDLFRARSTERREMVDLNPASAYEAVTRQMVNDLAREIADMRRRLDSLFYVVVSAIIVDVLLRLAGGGLS